LRSGVKKDGNASSPGSIDFKTATLDDSPMDQDDPNESEEASDSSEEEPPTKKSDAWSRSLKREYRAQNKAQRGRGRGRKQPSPIREKGKKSKKVMAEVENPTNKEIEMLKAELLSLKGVAAELQV